VGIIAMRKVRVVLIVVCILTFLMFAAAVIGVVNFGLPFGYYGQFNRVKSELRRIPDIRIVSTHLHKDWTLEDFGIAVQTKSGLRLRLQFSEDRETDEIFKRADGLLVASSTFWGKGLVYSLGPDGRLDVATGRKIRNAVHVLENFDKIAEVVEIDRRKGAAETTKVPKKCLCIYYPIPF
jgi:hypothetical protein